MRVQDSVQLQASQAARVAQAGQLPPARRAGRAGAIFSLDLAEAPRASQRAAAPMPAVMLDSLLAVQAVGDALERRRRAVHKGRDTLDVLDDLKLAILAGRVTPDLLVRLREMLKARRERVDDPALDDVLAHIELRAAVEAAKLEKAR